MITVEKLKRCAEELRDEITNERTGPLIDAMAMDILAERENVLRRLVEKLNRE